MAKLHADPVHAEAVASRLSARGFPHLRARKRGELVVIESGPDDDPIPHARLRRDTVQLWRLEIATHTGRWEPTGIRAPLNDILDVLVHDFPWVLTPVV
ncbi:hypothetical protein BE21_57635 [Sorangium cellulosum]|uniref:Uncharacterized protein n=1 Tax=Sorangium cellulosum TaxID=56 RepID=A0A150U356_SORCE|nr:hypothetical protein BE21_57635 [Sorangium cellulosum]